MTKPSDSSRGWVWPTLLIVAVVAIAAYVYFIVLRPVAVVAEVYAGRAFNMVPGSVEVKAEYLQELKSEVGGRIVMSVLDPGRAVLKDEVLVQLDSGDVDIEIEDIKSEIVAAKRKFEIGSTLRAEVENKKDTLDNLERQAKVGSYPVAEFEKEKRLYQQLVQRRELEDVALKQSLESLENRLRTKEREKSKMTITSPTDGVISTIGLAARAGDLIGRDNVIATLISSARAVEAKISEENFAGIKVGQKASVRFLGYGSQTYNASVIKVLPTANPETQRYTVHLSVELPQEKLVPGLTGEVTIVVDSREAQAIIPRRGLRGNQVLAVKDGRVEMRTVEPGFLANNAEILKGLRVKEQVIVENLDQFRPGDRVRTKLAK